MKESILKILHTYWGYLSFRPLQEDIIQHIIEGKDTLAVLPTGGGKSICYQIPALYFKGITVVVSPLIALMKDQVEQLVSRKVKAYALYTGMQKNEMEDIYEKLYYDKEGILYVSPERLLSQRFQEESQQWRISLIAVDEAHCISQWGYDFRPPYLQIADFRDLFNYPIPIIALTASATLKVQADIKEKLKMQQSKVFFNSFFRPNISFSVREVENKQNKLLQIIKNVSGSKIVYCNSRNQCVNLAMLLRSHGFSADFYHAGLTTENRNARQNDWILNKTETIVCTNAFGMGIDKADVRCVIHYDVPQMPEAYYQEAGRAGRDGKKSYAVVLYQHNNYEQLFHDIIYKFPNEQKIRKIYEDVCYALQIPIYTAPATEYAFDFISFCKQFKHHPLEVLSTFKILESNQILHFEESDQRKSTVQVIADREQMQSIEKTHKAWDEILKFLLRLYGGIINYPITISEFFIATHMQVSEEYVCEMLSVLHQHGIINYKARSNKPVLFFLQNRIPAQDLIIDTTLQQILKKRYEYRLSYMQQWVQNQYKCRQNNLLKYFDENRKQPCGICDNCLLQSQEISNEEFETIKKDILHQISKHGELSLEEYCNNSHTKTEKILKIVRYLLDKKSIERNNTGELILKK